MVWLFWVDKMNATKSRKSFSSLIGQLNMLLLLLSFLTSAWDWGESKKQEDDSSTTINSSNDIVVKFTLDNCINTIFLWETLSHRLGRIEKRNITNTTTIKFVFIVPNLVDLFLIIILSSLINIVRRSTALWSNNFVIAFLEWCEFFLLSIIIIYTEFHWQVTIGSLIFPSSLEGLGEGLLIHVIFDNIVMISFAWASWWAHQLIDEFLVHRFSKISSRLPVQTCNFTVAYLILIPGWVFVTHSKSESGKQNSTWYNSEKAKWACTNTASPFTWKE